MKLYAIGYSRSADGDAYVFGEAATPRGLMLSIMRWAKANGYDDEEVVKLVYGDVLQQITTAVNKRAGQYHEITIPDEDAGEEIRFTLQVGAWAPRNSHGA